VELADLRSGDIVGWLRPGGSTTRVRVFASSRDFIYCVTEEADQKLKIDAGDVLAFDRHTGRETDVQIFPRHAGGPVRGS
jgi:hypothetical protein